jgi:hypothetical protein
MGVRPCGGMFVSRILWLCWLAGECMHLLSVTTAVRMRTFGRGCVRTIHYGIGNNGLTKH